MIVQTLIAGLLLFGYYAYYKYRELDLTLFFPVLVYSVVFGAYYLPSFESIRITSFVSSPNSAGYELYFGWNKLIIALSILLFWNAQEKPVLSVRACWLIIVGVLLVLGYATLADYIRLEPTTLPTQLIILWACKNLFLVVLGEELFFRGFIQREVSYLISPTIGILASSVAFGLGHLGGGVLYALLATVAGLFYGAVYQETRRIEMCIFLHFILNLVHILFFTYPYAVK